MAGATRVRLAQIAGTGNDPPMKLHANLTINGKLYPAGTVVPWFRIYPFFLVHMLVFGLSGFFMAYSADGPDIGFLYLHGGIAIFAYTLFYFAIFGVDEVKWMFINAALGLFGIYAQIGFILALFGKQAGDFPPSVHAVPFLYYVLYTFLLYQMVMDLSGARETAGRKRVVERLYVVLSLVAYATLWLISR